jgi:hypothetical protein
VSSVSGGPTSVSAGVIVGGVLMYTILELQDENSEAVKGALKRVCGICKAPKGERCHSLSPKFKLNRIVHWSRAESFLDRKQTA